MPKKNPGEPFYRINSEEAKQMLESDPNVAVVDVRNPDEYAAGHVTDALFMPVDTVLARFDELPKDKTLLFICAMGQRSALACEMSAAMGIDSEKLYNIEDGTPAGCSATTPSAMATSRKHNERKGSNV